MKLPSAGIRLSFPDGELVGHALAAWSPRLLTVKAASVVLTDLDAAARGELRTLFLEEARPEQRSHPTLSPDGRRAAWRCEGQKAYVVVDLDVPGDLFTCDAAALKRRKTVSEAHIQALAFHPGGEVLAVALGQDSLVELRRWSDDVCVGRFACVGTATRLAFSPDGRHLAVVLATGRLEVWSLVERRCIGTLEVPQTNHIDLGFSADEALLLTAGRTAHRLPLDGGAGRAESRPRRPDVLRQEYLSLSPGGRFILQEEEDYHVVALETRDLAAAGGPWEVGSRWWTRLDCRGRLVLLSTSDGLEIMSGTGLEEVRPTPFPLPTGPAETWRELERRPTPAGLTDGAAKDWRAYETALEAIAAKRGLDRAEADRLAQDLLVRLARLQETVRTVGNWEAVLEFSRAGARLMSRLGSERPDSGTVLRSTIEGALRSPRPATLSYHKLIGAADLVYDARETALADELTGQPGFLASVAGPSALIARQLGFEAVVREHRQAVLARTLAPTAVADGLASAAEPGAAAAWVLIGWLGLPPDGLEPVKALLADGHRPRAVRAGAAAVIALHHDLSPPGPLDAATRAAVDDALATLTERCRFALLVPEKTPDIRLRDGTPEVQHDPLASPVVPVEAPRGETASGPDADAASASAGAAVVPADSDRPEEAVSEPQQEGGWFRRLLARLGFGRASRGTSTRAAGAFGALDRALDTLAELGGETGVDLAAASATIVSAAARHVVVLAGGSSSSYREFDVGREVRRIELAGFEGFMRAAVSHDGRHLALGHPDGRIVLCRLPTAGTPSRRTRLETVTARLEGPIACLAFRPDGQVLVAGVAKPPSLVLLDAELRRLGGLHLHDVPLLVAFGAGGRVLGCVEALLRVTAWTLSAAGVPENRHGADLGLPLVRRLSIQTMASVRAFHVEEGLARIAWADGVLQTFRDGQVRRDTVLGPARVKKPGADLLEQGAALNVHLVGPKRNAMLADDPKGVLKAAAFSPRGEFLAVSRDDGRITVWRLVDGPPVVLIDEPARTASHLGLGSDGRLLHVAPMETAAFVVRQIADLREAAPEPPPPIPRPSGRPHWNDPVAVAVPPIEPQAEYVYKQLLLTMAQRGDGLGEAERDRLRHQVLPRLAKAGAAASQVHLLAPLMRTLADLQGGRVDERGRADHKARETCRKYAALSDADRDLVRRALGAEDFDELLEFYAAATG